MPLKNNWVDGDSFAASDANAVGTAINSFGTAPTGAVVGTTDAQALTNKEIQPRIGTVASIAVPSISVDLYDQYNITALALNITSVTVSGTPVDGQKLLVRIKDNGVAARTIAWGASFVSSGVALLPTSTTLSKTHLVGLIYDAVATKWVCVASDTTGY